MATAGNAGRACLRQVGSQPRLVERGFHRAIGAQALVRLDDALVEHLRLDDLLGEDVRARLIADLDLVLQAFGDDQHRPLALALEQRVGGDRRAHLHTRNTVRRNWRIGSDLEKLADAFQRRVLVGLRVLRQDFPGVHPPVRRPRHDIGERAATVDPEVPPARPVAARASIGHALVPSYLPAAAPVTRQRQLTRL